MSNIPFSVSENPSAKLGTTVTGIKPPTFSCVETLVSKIPLLAVACIKAKPWFLRMNTINCMTSIKKSYNSSMESVMPPTVVISDRTRRNVSSREKKDDLYSSSSTELERLESFLVNLTRYLWFIMTTMKSLLPGGESL